MAWTNSLFLTVVAGFSAVEPPVARLENPQLRLTVLLPDSLTGKYRGQRFDWSGMISQVEFAGHRLFGPFRDTDEPLHHDANAIGTAEEFDPRTPLGFEAAKPGEWFFKIGVGHIQRETADPYRFSHVSAGFKPTPWTVTTKPNRIEFEQLQPPSSGWGWKYGKTVEIDGSKARFVIRRTLTNLGMRTIDGEHYGHHFFRIDNLPVGPDYRMRLPTALKPDKPTKASVTGNVLTLSERCGEPFMAWFDKVPNDLPHDFTVEHQSAKIRVHIHGDRPLLKLRLYVAPTAFCTEPFTKIHVEPGKTFEWASEYRLSKIP